jgi:DNA-binding NarL/FixJ family response regulator
MVRDAIAQLMSDLDSAVEVLEAADCQAALRVAAANPDVDLVLLDLNLPGVHGLAAVHRFRQEHPATPLVVVSAMRDRPLIQQAISAGAMGFIPKSSPRQTFVDALRMVLAGTVYIPLDAGTSIAEVTGGGSEGSASTGDLARELTLRQRQVLGLLMRGYSNKEICRALTLAERTVKVHLTAVLNALQVSSRAQAIVVANRLGLDADALLASAAED